MRIPSTILAALCGACFAIGPAQAATSTYSSQTVQSGKPARIGVLVAFKKDCSLGELGDIKVVTVPKNGSLVVRSGKLKTPSSFRCPNVETPAKALFYQPNGNFSGPDEVTYETHTADGTVQSFTVRITVSKAPEGGKPAQGGKPTDKKSDSLDL